MVSFAPSSCRPQGVGKDVQMTQEGSFVALSIIVFLHEFLEPAMQNGWSETLSFHCLGKTDEGAPEWLLLSGVIESSFK